MKSITKKATACLLALCMIVSFASVFGSVTAAQEGAPIDGIFSTGNKTELIIGSTYTFEELFGSGYVYAPDLNALAEKIAAKGLTAENMQKLLGSALYSVGLDAKTMTPEDILNLPDNIKDDLVTYIFAGLKALGVDVDPAYEKLPSSTIMHWFVRICFGFVPANLNALEEKIAAQGLSASDMQKLLASALESLGQRLSSLTPEDILNLPAKIMDEVVTYIFAGLKALGVDVDPLYEKLSSNKIIKWFIETFFSAFQKVGDLTILAEKIAAKGYTAENMQKLLASALSSVGLDAKTMTPEDILNLPADVMDDVVTYIFAGLKALGVDVDPAYEKLSSNKILTWFIRKYYITNEPLWVTCDVPDMVIVDNENHTVYVTPDAKEDTEVTFTLNVTDPDSEHAPILYTAVIRKAPKELIDWVRELWQALRAFKLKEVVSILKDFIRTVIFGK